MAIIDFYNRNDEELVKSGLRNVLLSYQSTDFIKTHFFQKKLENIAESNNIDVTDIFITNYNFLPKLALKDIEGMKVIEQGQMDNLIIRCGNVKVWHSRMTKEDGMPYNNQITVEALDENYNWRTVKEYKPL
jgi:hypothetical protein